MSGIIVMTIVVPFADAAEIERRAEIKQLREPSEWLARTDAILDELQLSRQVFLSPTADRDGTEQTKFFQIAGAVSEAEVVAGGPHRAHRRAIHEAYLELLLEDEEDENGEEDQADSASD